MKTFVAVVVGMAIAVSAQAAGAYVVQVVATIPVAAVTSAEDTAQLRGIVQTAIRDVLDHAIAFDPTVVQIEDATIVGERLYLVLLIADEAGEATIEELVKGRASRTERDAPDGETAEGRVDPNAAWF